MKRQFPVIKAEECIHCPAFMVDAGSVVWASGFSIISSHLAAQVTEGGWNAVVTTLAKGTFLVRRLKELPADACPLRAYDVRHVAAYSPSRRGRMVGVATMNAGKK